MYPVCICGFCLQVSCVYTFELLIQGVKVCLGGNRFERSDSSDMCIGIGEVQRHEKSNQFGLWGQQALISLCS